MRLSRIEGKLELSFAFIAMESQPTVISYSLKTSGSILITIAGRFMIRPDAVKVLLAFHASTHRAS
jgi:hypothetical protein